MLTPTLNTIYLPCTSYTARLNAVTFPHNGGAWIVSTHTEIDGHICEDMTLAELIEGYGFDNVTTNADGSVTFTD